MRKTSTLAFRVASRYIQKQGDLIPPLGYPGGVGFLVDRVVEEVVDPRLESFLVNKVEDGADLSNPEAGKVYDTDVEKPPAQTRFQRLLLGPHSQYRMDLRGITVPEIRAALTNFNKAFNDARSRKEPWARKIEEQLLRSESITWEDKKLGLVVAFASERNGADVKIMTVYRPGEKQG